MSEARPGQEITTLGGETFSLVVKWTKCPAGRVVWWAIGRDGKLHEVELTPDGWSEYDEN